MTQPKRAKPAGLPLSAGYGNVVHNLAAASDRPVRMGGRLIDTSKLTPVDAEELRAGAQTGAPPAKAPTSAERLWGHPVQPSPVKLDPGKDIAGGTLELPVMDIRPYDGDPRSQPNESYEELKASVLKLGLFRRLTVTKRPGDTHYMIGAGGNTLLRLLKDLYQAGNTQFARVKCDFIEYGSDLLIEARHFAENNGRGGVSFWDNARQIAKMKSLLETERGKSLSAMDLSEELAQHGIRASKALINVWLFAVERLAAFGPATRCLTTRSVQHVYRQQLTELGKLAALSPLSADKYWKEVVPEVLARCGQDFDESGQEPDPQQVCTNLEIALGARLEIDHDMLKDYAKLLALNGAHSWASLKASHSQGILQRALATSRSDETGSAGAASVDEEAPPRTQQVSDTHQQNAAAAVAPSTSAPASPSAARPEPRVDAAPPPAEPATAEASPARFPAVEAALRKVFALAEQVGLVGCLRTAPHMPFGYYIELPGEADLANAHPDAGKVFALLAMCSMQYDRGLVAKHLPDSRWAAVCASGEFDPTPIQDAFGWDAFTWVALDSALIDPDDALGAMAVELLVLVRAAAEQHRDRLPRKA